MEQLKETLHCYILENEILEYELEGRTNEKD
jgi:hypothetical protein